jgi:hypothetical protein
MLSLSAWVPALCRRRVQGRRAVESLSAPTVLCGTKQRVSSPPHTHTKIVPPTLWLTLEFDSTPLRLPGRGWSYQGLVGGCLVPKSRRSLVPPGPAWQPHPTFLEHPCTRMAVIYPHALSTTGLTGWGCAADHVFFFDSSFVVMNPDRKPSECNILGFQFGSS